MINSHLKERKSELNIPTFIFHVVVSGFIRQKTIVYAKCMLAEACYPLIFLKVFPSVP